MVKESVQQAVDVDTSGGDWTDSESPTGKIGLLYCVTAGDANIEFANGVTTAKTKEAGEYWRVSPTKVFQTSTAVLQMHY